jgi:hypothetical protein
LENAVGDSSGVRTDRFSRRGVLVFTQLCSNRAVRVIPRLEA